MSAHANSWSRLVAAAHSTPSRKRCPIVLAIAVALGAMALRVSLPLIAADKTLQPFGILWSSPTSWFPGGEPRAGDNVFITVGPPILFAPIDGIGETFASLTVNAPFSTMYFPTFGFPLPVPDMNMGDEFPAGVILAAGALRTVDTVLGDTFAGRILQTGGLHSVTNDLVLGRDSGGNGFYNLADPTLVTAELNVGRNLVLGDRGAGYLGQLGGRVRVGQNLALANQAGARGAVDFAGQLDVAGQAIVGAAGVGWATQGLGTLNVGGDLKIARDAGSTASYITLPGAALNVGGFAVVGEHGTATMSLDGAVANIGTTLAGGADLVLGQKATGNGTVLLLGANALSVSRDLVIGDAGVGSLSQVSAGGVTVSRDLVIGRAAAGSGNLNLAGGGIDVIGQIVIGDRGSGELHQSLSGAFRTRGDLILGRAQGGSGTYRRVAGGGATIDADLVVGDAGSGVVEITNDLGGIAAGRDLILARSPGASATFSASSATISAAGTFVAGASGQATVTWAGGALGTRHLIVAQGAGSDANVTLSGMSAIVSDMLIVGHGGTGRLTFDGGTIDTLLSVGSLSVGRSAGAIGTVTLRGGGGMRVAADAAIGGLGQGAVVQEGGDHRVAGTLRIAPGAGGTGRYDLGGGVLSATTVQIGNGGSLIRTGGEFSWLCSRYLRMVSRADGQSQE